MTDVELYSSALRPVLRSIVTKLLVSIGTALAAHGYMTDAPVAGDVAPFAQELVGGLIALASALYAAYAAKRKNDKALVAAVSVPGDGTTVRVDGVVVNER